MRKLALLVAAALIVSAPMLTTGTTDVFAAAKKKEAAAPKAPDNRGLFDALGDNAQGKSVAAKILLDASLQHSLDVHLCPMLSDRIEPATA